MTRPEEPFRLEDAEPGPRRPPGLPDVNGEAVHGAQERERSAEPTVDPRRAGRRPGDASDVDERTVAERTGKAVERVRGVRPPPPGWPVEAFVFPLRGKGPVMIAALAVAWALLDALGTTPLAFLGLVLKIPFLAFLLRWHLHEAGMTAAGLDKPAGFARVLDMDHAAMRGFLQILAIAIGVGIPGLVAAMFRSWALAVVLWIVGSAWLSVALLGAAVGDRALAWPWRASEWLVRRPLPFLAGALAPWALALSETLVFALADASFAGALAAAFGVRCVVLYVWLLSARAIGVAGRAWTPS